MEWKDKTHKQRLKEIKTYADLPRLRNGYVYVTESDQPGWLGVHGEESSTFRISLYDGMVYVKANRYYDLDRRQHWHCFKGYKYYKERRKQKRLSMK